MKGGGWIEAGMRQWRVVLTVIALLVGAGVAAFLTMPRQEFPEFTIRQGLVVGVMPGASSEEVELRLAKPVEDYLFGFDEVNKRKTWSVSKAGQLVVYVELNDDVAGLEAPAFWAKLRHGLNELKGRLPNQVLALIGNNDFGDTSALLFTVAAKGRSPRELEDFLEVLEKHLRRIEATSKLKCVGLQDEVLRVTLSREKLSRYGLRPAMVWAALQGMGGAPAPARLDLDQLELPVHLQPVLSSEAEVAELALLALPGGGQLRLKDVAEMRREYGHDDSFVRYNGETALVLSIEMQAGRDITAFGREVEIALDRTRAELPADVEIARVADQPDVVRNSVGHFLRDFGLAIASVILVTMLLLPFRVAAVAAISIPICVAITLAVLNAIGIQLHTVSLAALVIVLGMVVDNAIVVIDDHVDRLDRGVDPWTAAWSSAKELTIPVLTATVAIVFSYVPLPLFLDGQAGDFLRSLPPTIAVALGTSFVLAMLLVPILDNWLIRSGIHREGGRPTLLDRMQRLFDGQFERAFRHPKTTMTIGAVAVMASLLLATKVPQQPFPKVERDQFAVEVTLPPGRSLSQTDAVIQRLETLLLADERVVDVTAFVGQSSPRFHSVYAPRMPGRNVGQLLVNTVSEEATVELLHEFSRSQASAFPEGWVRWKQLEMQFGNPVEVRLIGEDPARLKAVAAELEAFARGLPQTSWVRNDWEQAQATVEVHPDLDACTSLGVPPSLLQASLAMGTRGLPVGTIWEGDYPVSVLLQDEDGARSRIEGLRQHLVSSALGGSSIPLEQLAELRPGFSEGAIAHRNGVRTLTVQIDVGFDALGSEVQAAMEEHVAGLTTPGVEIEYGGEKELSEKVFLPMGLSLAVSVVLIFLVLLVQFGRFRTVFVVMASMPLALPGAIGGLALAGYPFGVTAFLGIIGLMGIVVRNGVILVTYAEELRARDGLSAKEAAMAAGKRRMRPIYLTAMAAAIGVVPMILSRSSLWGPLGTVTCFGLLGGMVLTLFVLPLVYAAVAESRGGTRRDTGFRRVVVPLLACLLLAGRVSAQPTEAAYGLGDCRRLTLANTSSLKEARLEVEAAEQTRKAAFTKHFPQLSASALALEADKPLIEFSTEGGNLPVYDGDPANLGAATQWAWMPGLELAAGQSTNLLTVTALQPIYAGGRVLNGNRLAKSGVTVAELKGELATREALQATEEKYWRLATLQEKRRTLAAYEELLAELERRAADGLRAGLLTRNDLLKVQLKRAEAAADRRRLDDGLRLASRDMRRHLGLPDGDGFLLADSLARPLPPVEDGADSAAALAARPELRLLETAVLAQRLERKLAIGEALPSVSVGASWYRADLEGLRTMDNGLVFGLVSLPISGLWEGAHQRAARLRHERVAEERLAETRRLIELQVEQAASARRIAWEDHRAAERAVEQAELNLGEQGDRYAAGLSAFSDLLEARVLQQQALTRRLESREACWLAEAAWRRATMQEEPRP